MGLEKPDEIVPDQKPVLVKKPGKTDVGEGAKARKESAVLPFDLEVYKIAKLENGVSCTKKTVVGPDIFGCEYHGNGIFILHFADTQYEPFDLAPLFFLSIIVKMMLKNAYAESTQGRAEAGINLNLTYI